jgi:hypothetical protein
MGGENCRLRRRELGLDLFRHLEERQVEGNERGTKEERMEGGKILNTTGTTVTKEERKESGEIKLGVDIRYSRIGNSEWKKCVWGGGRA